ncbi:hypothetical protein SAMN04487914_11824 [Arthrobacter sp. ok909]|nr:hypothetical protein SAMN04487914_11824 [Arthrobacter sp. ok909]
MYAKGEGDVKTCVVDPPCLAIHCHALNLEQPPNQLLADGDLLAARIAGPLIAKRAGTYGVTR